MDQETQAMQLGVQLGVSALLVLIMTLVHSLGLLAALKLLPIDNERLEARNFDL